MKRLLFVALTVVFIATMAACAFLLAEPQILLYGKEVNAITMEVGDNRVLSTNHIQNVAWQSSDDTVVKVTSVGKLFALKEGTVTVTLTAAGRTKTVTVTVITQPTMWTIGDSIFDLNDNEQASAVQQMVKEAGYINSCMDNIAGSTIYSGTGNKNSILEHINAGLYDEFYDRHGAPDVIVIFRGTNDVWETVNRPELFPKSALEQSVRQVCQYFSTKYPDARIVWATPVWRIRIDETVMEEFRQMLHTVCPEYGVEVFDLHLEEPFASINDGNYADVLYDGIHPSYSASLKMKDAFVKYLTGN